MVECWKYPHCGTVIIACNRSELYILAWEHRTLEIGKQRWLEDP